MLQKYSVSQFKGTRMLQIGAEMICYFPGKQCTRIPLTAVQMTIIEDTLGLQLKDGLIHCYTDKKLKELYFDDEEVVAAEEN